MLGFQLFSAASICDWVGGKMEMYLFRKCILECNKHMQSRFFSAQRGQTTSQPLFCPGRSCKQVCCENFSGNLNPNLDGGSC